MSAAMHETGLQMREQPPELVERFIAQSESRAQSHRRKDPMNLEAKIMFKSRKITKRRRESQE
ncbi:unnamed protein product [Kuraishia capsulata CBS 1993]|uniref:Uncharacterized protein n=1 Tax=Kuraishia capsulata CBS 1993 TaxID=1382522 RepID=W6MM75_9ASCO|nr:uncharacterized protein KUCA_T00001963001 [Kuraishia capsulata CBS 1993]CDK25992.1 unnamed protein product [Kuraishia capsulata CBS 1993]